MNAQMDVVHICIGNGWLAGLSGTYKHARRPMFESWEMCCIRICSFFRIHAHATPATEKWLCHFLFINNVIIKKWKRKNRKIWEVGNNSNCYRKGKSINTAATGWITDMREKAIRRSLTNPAHSFKNASNELFNVRNGTEWWGCWCEQHHCRYHPLSSTDGH